MRRSKASAFYVYYRIAADTRATRQRIGALIDDVEARTGIRGKLSARSEDPTTWMELYEPVAQRASFRRLLAAVARTHEAQALTVDGVRHVEEFSSLPSLPRRRKP